LVVLTDAGENSSSHEWSQVVSAALENEVIVYAIYFSSGTRDGAPERLRNIAGQTGGKVYTATARELESVYAAVAHDIRSYHQLMFRVRSEDIANPRRWRRISIEVRNRPDVRLFARAGYCPLSPCQTDDGVFVGQRPRTLEDVAALTRDEAPALVERLRELRFEHGPETRAIVRSFGREPVIVEKRWAAATRPPAREEVRYVITRDRNVSIDSEVCGLRVETDIEAAPGPSGPRSLRPTAPRTFTVANPAVRTIARPGGGPDDRYFQSQVMFDLRDAAENVRIAVRCHRPNYLVSQDLLDFAVHAVELSLKVKAAGPANR
jgi:hypothetical protein